MHSPSKIEAGSEPLFLDASVIINLTGSGLADEILNRLGRPILIAKQALNEFKRNPRNGDTSHNVIKSLKQLNRITIHELSEIQFGSFLALTAAPSPDDLGDGEAATLASATGIGAAVIDEAKALRIAARDFPQLKVYSTLDLICCDQIIRTLGKSFVATAVFDSIVHSRMRVPFAWKPWICNLLGKSRLAELSGRATWPGSK